MTNNRNAGASSKRKQSNPDRSFFEPLESRRLLSAVVSNPVVVAAVSAATSAEPVAFTGSAHFRVINATYDNGPVANGQTIVGVDAFSDPNLVANLTGFRGHFEFDAFAGPGQFGGTFAVQETNVDSLFTNSEISPAVDVAGRIGFDTSTGSSVPSPAFVATLSAFTAASSVTSSSKVTGISTNGAILNDGPASPTPAFENLQSTANPRPLFAREGTDATITATTSAAETGAVISTPTNPGLIDSTNAFEDSTAVNLFPTAGAIAASAITPLVTALEIGASSALSANLPEGQAIIQWFNLSATVAASASETLLPSIGQAFSDSVIDVGNDLGAVTSTFSDLRGSDGMAGAALIAEVALLAYCYSNRNRQKATGLESLFSDAQGLFI
jgi:hypothetical protein